MRLLSGSFIYIGAMWQHTRCIGHLLISIWFLSSIHHSPLSLFLLDLQTFFFPDRTYVLTDVIILAQRRKTDDLSSKLKLKNCFAFFSVWGWVGERGQLLIFHSAPYFSLQLHYKSGLHSLILWKFVFREGRKIVLWGKLTVGWRSPLKIWAFSLEEYGKHSLSPQTRLKADMTWLFYGSNYQETQQNIL